MKQTLTHYIVRRLTLALMVMTWSVAQGDTLTKIDSLLTAYGNSRGSKHADIGRQLLKIYDEGAVFFGDTPTLAAGMSRDEQDLTVWFATARYYTTTSYYAEALDYISRCLSLHPGSFHTTLLCDKSYCLFKRSDYTAAIEAGQEAVRLCQKENDWMQLSRAYLYLSLVNHSLRKYDEAKALVVKSIETNERLGVNVQTHNALGIACEIFCSAMEIDQAISYGRQAVEAARQIGYQPGVANHMTQLSYAYDRKGDYQLGLQMADSAIAMVKATEPLDRNQLALCLEYKGWNLIDIGRPREAAEALRQAIALQQQVGNTHAVWYDYRTLSEALEPIDPHGSIEALKRYTRMGDSIHSEQLKELMTQANAEFHNDELKDENDATRRMNRIIFWSAVAVVLMLTAVIVSLLYASRQKSRTTKALQRLTAARDEFFTNVTHEFRTPLTVILGYGEELKELKLAPASLEHEVHGMAEAIVRQGEQLLQLVSQLLDLSKLKSAIVKQTPAAGDLTACVAMIAETHRELARQKNVTLSFDTDATPIVTTFVADYVQKVAGNLLSNAVKFTPEGGTVTVSLHRHDQLSVLTVSDTGCGISAQDLPHIYEPFFRADTAGSPGSGVGLALVKQIADEMGATISVESQETVGTTFRVALPTANVATIESQKPEPLKSDEAPSGAVRGASVLIVEDNADVGSYIGRMMSPHYDVHYATDGEQGLAAARELMPDLIITDVMMPGMDGLEMCRAIRADQLTDHIPMIVVTAKATDDDRISGLEAGADAYLVKPFNARELSVRVEKLLEMRQQLRAKYQQPATADAESHQPATEAGFEAKGAQFVSELRQHVLILMPQKQASVENLAAEMNMTAPQLRRKMSAVAGVSPKKFIADIQMETATRLLTEQPERTLYDIATACGFYDQSHLVRLFRSTYGMTPMEYAKSKQQPKSIG